MSDAQKARALSGKCLKSQGMLTSEGGRPIYYYCFFVPSRDHWTQAAARNQLYLTTDPEATRENSDIQPGIFVSTKGMPTGIELPPPIRGGAGYWPNFLALLEHDSFTFDLGRKTVPGRSQGMLKDLALNQLNQMTRWFLSAGPGRRTTTGPIAVAVAARENEFASLQAIANLGLREINYLKQPNGQEAAVVAIFHELVGKGLLLGYCGMGSGYKKPYDFWGKYRIDKSNLGQQIRDATEIRQQIDQNVVIEFKFNAASLIEDVTDQRKRFEDIDLVVCWDVDENAFQQAGITVSPFPPEEVFYYGSNYRLEWPGTYDLGNRSETPVISLRRFVEDLRRQ